MIKVYNNFLEEDNFKNLQGLILSEMFPWVFSYGKVHFPQKNENDWRFCHLVWEPGDGIVSPLQFGLWNLIVPLMNKLDIAAITRVKLNCDIKGNKPFLSDFHVDHNFPNSVNAYTGIFYLNDNNGYTEFESGEKVNSTSNTLVLFRSDKKHRGVSQTDIARRVVLNINVMLSDGNSYNTNSHTI